jgi:hypothetical protein
MSHLSLDPLMLPYQAEPRALISLVENFMEALEEQRVNASNNTILII